MEERQSFDPSGHYSWLDIFQLIVKRYLLIAVASAEVSRDCKYFFRSTFY